MTRHCNRRAKNTRAVEWQHVDSVEKATNNVSGVQGTRHAPERGILDDNQPVAVVTVDFDELLSAFEFVGSAPSGENNAYLCLDTGKTHCTSEHGSLDEDVPN